MGERERRAKVERAREKRDRARSEQEECTEKQGRQRGMRMGRERASERES